MSEIDRRDKDEERASLEEAQQESLASWSPSSTAGPFASCVDRRAFLGGVQRWSAAPLSARRSGPGREPVVADSNRDGFGDPRHRSPYGLPEPVRDGTTNLKLIRLPKGFSTGRSGGQATLWAGRSGIPFRSRLLPCTTAWRSCGRRRTCLFWSEITRSIIPGPGAFGVAPNVYSAVAGGGCSNLVFDLQAPKVRARVREPERNGSQLLGRRHPLGDVVHLRGDQLRRPDGSEYPGQRGNRARLCLGVGPAGALQNPPQAVSCCRIRRWDVFRTKPWLLIRCRARVSDRRWPDHAN